MKVTAEQKKVEDRRAEETREKIKKYPASHYYLRLATVTPEGKPLAHTVDYVAEDATVYFISYVTTRKIQNIIKNPRVAYAVDENYDSMYSILGVQMEGSAEIVNDNAEIMRVMQTFVKKFPELEKMPPSEYIRVVRITPETGYFIDYTTGTLRRGKATF